MGVTTAVGIAVGVAAAAAVMFVVIEVRQVRSVPPAFPVPLHWLTLVKIAGLTTEAELTAQSAVEPPPVTEPLH